MARCSDGQERTSRRTRGLERRDFRLKTCTRIPERLRTMNYDAQRICALCDDTCAIFFYSRPTAVYVRFHYSGGQTHVPMYRCCGLVRLSAVLSCALSVTIKPTQWRATVIPESRSFLAKLTT